MEQRKFTLILITFFFLLIFQQNNLFSQAEIERNITPEEIAILLNGERKLVAEVNDSKIETAVIDSIMIMKLIELEGDDEDDEDEMSPADELYDGIWNNNYVKNYSSITIPDSFRIDLTSFVMPFEGRVTSPFGPRKRRFHYGTDIKLHVGDTVLATFEGKVRVRQYEPRGYGNYLVLRHPNGLETVYGHLSKFLVEEDENVEAGQPIALGGNTGRSTGSHLHFECRFLGQAIDPSDIIDFKNFCAYDDSYLFKKSRVNQISVNNRVNNNRYTASSSSSSKSSAQSQSVKYHRVRSGDTLSKISIKYGVSINTLCKLNGIRPTTILRVGRVLRYS